MKHCRVILIIARCYRCHSNATLMCLIVNDVVITILLCGHRHRTMDTEILFTFLLCVVAAVCTLVSLFLFAKKRQKSYEEVDAYSGSCDLFMCIHVVKVKQDEIKADLALSKELSGTPRSKPVAKQYKPWVNRKKKSDEVTSDSSAPDPAHDAAHVIPSEPIQVTEEIADQPVVKVTKKKRQHQTTVTPSPSVVASPAVTEAPPVEVTPSITVEAVPVEE